MTQTIQAALAYRRLLAAQDKYGSNCIDRPNEFSGLEQVTPEQANILCFGCPLRGLGNACQQYVAVATSLYGVYDGQWHDTHGNVEDVFNGLSWDEEVEMVLALGVEDTELVETTEGSEQ